ncbi:HAMP domain-containing sensor histidine kinase [Eubacteriaceae bacterium ES2]|nr:HAMP domain-containing sensor histidine kinase [Eubacteriaceae bacterium ES2]
MSAILTYGIIYHTRLGNVFDEDQTELVKQTEAILILDQKNMTHEELLQLFDRGIVAFRITNDLTDIEVNLEKDDLTTLNDGEIYFGYSQTEGLPVAIGKLQDGYVVAWPNLASDQLAGIINRQKATLLFTLLLGSILIFLASAMIVRPIKRISAATKKVANGDFDLQLKVKGEDEVAVLARNFNLMTQALSRNDYIHRDFVSNVSHEFKTPIASIKGFGKLLKDPELSEEKRQEYIEIIVEESERLGKLSANVLKLSELENGVIALKMDPFSLDECIRRVVLLLQEKWEAKELDLEVKLDEVMMLGDRELIDLVVINLFTNAINYSDIKGSIGLELAETMSEISLVIWDNGCGIDTEDQKKIFDRFYKADHSRSSPGSGLGLTIAQRIIALHDGSIEVISEFGKGSKFRVNLPKR